MTQQVLSEKVLYNAKKDPEIVQVPDTWCLAITGAGAPESQEFQQAVEALYGLAYTLKFRLKPAGLDFKVPALEGLWWVEGAQEWFVTPRDQWHWQLLIRMPDVVTEEHVAQTRPETAAKKQNPVILQIKYQRLVEGTAAQLLHVGSFATERSNIDRLHGFIEQHGYRPRGLHHEVYLSDFKRTAPEKLKTILRQPVEPIAP
ncbi:MAG TPA: GyrI-like domain-containing protein [Symbiobacteriaceae bacterium]|nr:GyrI-like domain-containing protein [Symbiobacteriaceae bacterium]